MRCTPAHTRRTISHAGAGKRARWRESSGGGVHLNLAERLRGASAPSRAIPDTVDRLVCASARTSVGETVIIHTRLGRGASRPDVILMDINLPGISGIQAPKIVRADPATAHIPVVAISANAMPRDIEKGLEAGFFNYLTHQGPPVHGYARRGAEICENGIGPRK